MPQNCFLVYSTALKAMVEEMRKIHNWLSDHVQKEQTMQGRLIYSLIVIDLRRELSDFEKRAEAFEEAGNKNKSADQETVEYINRTSNVIHAALREWKSEHQPDEDFDVVIDKHSMGSFLKVLKRLNEMNDVEEKNKSQRVLVNGMAGEDMVEKSVESEAKNGEKPQPKNGKGKHNGKRKRNGKKAQHEQSREPEQNQSALIEQSEPELAQQGPVQAAPAEPKPEQQREEQPEPPQQATSLEPQNAQKVQPKNGKRKQNGKRKRNGHQEQDGHQQEQPHEPEQNHSAQIDQQKPLQIPSEEVKSGQQQDQPEQPQQATSSLKLCDATVPAV